MLPLLCALSFANPRAEESVGIVDMSRLLRESTQGKQITASLRKQFDARLTELETEERSLRVIGGIRETTQARMDAEKAERDKLRAAYTEKAKKLTAEINARRTEEMKPLLAAIDAAVTVVQERRHLKSVKRTELFTDLSEENKKALQENTNVTAEVLEVLNDSFKTKK